MHVALRTLAALSLIAISGCWSPRAASSTGPNAAVAELSVLDALVGDFRVTGKPADPAVPAYTGKYRGRWVLGGNAVEVVATGTGASQGYEARALVSYDPTHGEYHAVSATNKTPGLSVRSEGRYDAANGELAFMRRGQDPQGQAVVMRFVHRFHPDGSFTLEAITMAEKAPLRSSYEHVPIR